MNQEKIGNFIAQSRKKVNLTQEELAEKLGISKNAVSKWERGLNLPDVSKMEELCAILKISLNELFAGEKLKYNEIKKQSEINLLDVLKLNDLKEKKYKLLSIFIIILVIIIIMILTRIILIKCGYIMDNNLVL